MPWSSNLSSQHAGFSRFLTVLGIVAVVVVVGYALSVLLKSGSENANTPSQDGASEIGQPSEVDTSVSAGSPDGLNGDVDESLIMNEVGNKKDAEGRTVLSGIASEVFSRKDNPELKWVTLSVAKEDGSFIDYKFVFDKEMKGDASLISGGERISISFFGEPSSEDAVVAGEMRMEKMD